MEDPTVSIVVRTFAGRHELLQEALDSVHAQSYRPIEVVVVEDGSETCKSTVRAFRECTDVSVTYRSSPKRGRCHAGSLGLKLTTGRFVSFLDDDDRLYSDHLQRLVPLLVADPDMPAAFARSEAVATTIRSLSPLDYSEDRRWTFRARAFTRWHLWYLNQFPIQACVFRRELYEEHGGLDERFEFMEDWELWARYLSNEGPVGFVNEVTSMFRLPTGRSSERRAREHDDHIASVLRQIRSIAVTLSAAEVREVSGRLLLDAFSDSPWLSKLWSILGRGALRRCILKPLAAAVVAATRVTTRRARASHTLGAAARELSDAVRDRRLDVVREVRVGEAQVVLRELWRTEETERYALLALRHLVSTRIAPGARRSLTRLASRA